eukprot:gene19574-biopygen14573
MPLIPFGFFIEIRECHCPGMTTWMNLFPAMCSLYKRQHPDREKCTVGVQQAHSSTGTKYTGLIQCAGCAKCTGGAQV